MLLSILLSLLLTQRGRHTAMERFVLVVVEGYRSALRRYLHLGGGLLLESRVIVLLAKNPRRRRLRLVGLIVTLAAHLVDHCELVSLVGLVRRYDVMRALGLRDTRGKPMSAHGVPPLFGLNGLEGRLGGDPCVFG